MIDKLKAKLFVMERIVKTKEVHPEFRKQMIKLLRVERKKLEEMEGLR